MVRLANTKVQIRTLFAKTGNQCAFPGCMQPLIDDDGDYLAEICHIEGAEEGSQRYNSEMAGLGRRGVNNLIVLCRIHHAKVDKTRENLLYRVYKRSKQVTTENNKKPDFIFPGKAEYFDPRFDGALLTMLGAKSTCKDRWSQILPEAERISVKHLVTLEPGISEKQTATMRKSHVQLVVPVAIQASYTKEQREWLYSVTDFVNLVARRQAQLE